MIDFLNSFKSLIKLEQIRTDNNVFKLHYKFTVIMLIVFSLLLTSKQYFGEPITCNVNDKKDVIDTYCWVFSTYILKSTIEDDILAGLGTDYIDHTHYDKEVYWQGYYQWVCIVFCFQALLFYTPRYLWKTWEGGRLRLLVKDLNGPLVTANWNNSVKRELVQYLLSGKYAHNLYALRYTLCETLNLINVVAQILFMDWFLTGHFTLYGVAVSILNEKNPMGRVFPKIAKCNMYQFGPSGTRENRDAMCILPLNMLNEKLFLILWFWLLFLLIVTILSIVYRCLVICLPKLRVYLLMAQARFIGSKRATVIIKELSYGDFFVLYQVGKNVNQIIFKELVLEIHETMKVKNPYRFFNEIEIH